MRVVPRARHVRAVCLRLELWGCTEATKEVEEVQEAKEEEVVEMTPLLEEVEQVQEVREVGPGDWSVHLPVALGVLLTTSVILLAVIISILLRMTRAKQLGAASPQTIYISRPQEEREEGGYMSNWFLHLSEPVYQEPSAPSRPLTSTYHTPALFSHYSEPLVPSVSNQVYSVPTTSTMDSSPSSTLSHQSTVETDLSCLEESGVDSAPSTPRPLPSTPSTPRLPVWSRDLVDAGILLSPFYSYDRSNIV